MLSVGVVGATNAGKSTLLNALLGQRVLPSGRMSCTSVLAHCLLDGGSRSEQGDGVAAGDAVLVCDGKNACGAADVRSVLELYNKQAREDPEGRVVDVLVRVGARPELHAVMDGRLKFMDVPGHNETDNPAVRECKDVVLSLCHGLIVTVKYDQINSEETAQLVDSIARDAPHLFDARDGTSALAFVITQVDLFEADCPDDDDDDIEDKPGLVDLKCKFKEFLQQRESLCHFHGWSESVPIFATAISKDILRGRSVSHDLEPLLMYILALHQRRKELIDTRKVVYASAIHASFCDALTSWTCSEVHPCYARDVLEQHDLQVRRKVIFTTISAGTLLIGGWMACAAWAARSVAIVNAAAMHSAAASAGAAAVTASAEAASAAAAAASATAAADAALASTASIGAAASAVGNYATGVGTVATIAVDGGMTAPIVGTATGYTAKLLSWTAFGGISASRAASVATTAAAVATANAAVAAGTESSALAAAAVASAGASNAAAAVASATTTAAGLTGLALAGGTAAVRAALAGNEPIITAPDLGCLGAQRAVDEITIPTRHAILNSEASGSRPYEDFLTWSGSDRVLYVGQFRGKVPHGTGRLFWEDTQVECFIGEFRDGNIDEGVFISKRQVAIGSLKRQVHSDGEARLVVHGFQPESVYDPQEPCVICLENPTILMEGRVMLPCHHGCVCASCFSTLQECPLCRTQIQGDIRVC